MERILTVERYVLEYNLLQDHSNFWKVLLFFFYRFSQFVELLPDQCHEKLENIRRNISSHFGDFWLIFWWMRGLLVTTSPLLPKNPRWPPKSKMAAEGYLKKQSKPNILCLCSNQYFNHYYLFKEQLNTNKTRGLMHIEIQVLIFWFCRNPGLYTWVSLLKYW